MIVLFFIIVLQMSVIVHVYFLVNFLSRGQDKDFKGFFVTTVINIAMGIFISIFIIMFPRQLRDINLDRLLFIESGVIFVVMIYIKVRITRNIIKKRKDPANYHLNAFGKKVYHPNTTTFKDVISYFLTLPFTLFCGAYFVTKLSCIR